MTQPVLCPDLTRFGAKYIDNGFWRISKKTARELCGPDPLPRYGYYRVISIDGCRYEIHQTIVKGLPVWAITVTSRPSLPNPD
jgi:hypothetical protein